MTHEMGTHWVKIKQVLVFSLCIKHSLQFLCSIWGSHRSSYEEYYLLSPAFTLVSCSAYSTLKMKAIYFSETSVDFQWTSRHYLPDEGTINVIKPVIYNSTFKNFHEVYVSITITAKQLSLSDSLPLSSVGSSGFDFFGFPYNNLGGGAEHRLPPFVQPPT
jgi:hypothetical protein